MTGRPWVLLLLAAALAAASAPTAAAAASGPSAGRRLAVPNWPWPQPDVPGGGAFNSTWERTLELLWNHTHDKLGFCVGASQWRAQRLMAASFPWPLPTLDDPADAVCSNASLVDAHLCGPAELEQYYKFMLLTESPEKIPDNKHCTADSAGQLACSPGFFDERLQNRPATVVPQQAHACCPGFFCPPQLTCMIPCPLGAYCPRARAALPPEWYRGHGEALWCAPYAYKARQELGCGGADKWRIVPGSAFPITGWSEGSGSIYCDGGSYCPNTTAMLPCTDRHFCRQGSTEEERCPPGVACPAGTEIPDNNITGVAVDALLLGLLWLAWAVAERYNRVLQRISRKERLKITWGWMGEPRITVVKAAANGGSGGGGGGSGSQPHSRSHSRSYSYSHSRSQSLSRRHSLGGEGAPAAHGGDGAAAAAAGGAQAGSGRGKGGGGGRGGALGLLGYVKQRGPRRAAGGGGGRAQGQPVWAAWSGPGGEADAGYEPLLEDQPVHTPRGPLLLSGTVGGGAADGSNGADEFELSPPRRPLSPGIGPAEPPGQQPGQEPGQLDVAPPQHARHASIDYEGELTPRHLHSLLVAQHRQSLLSSPLSSVHAGAGVRRVSLRVEFRELGLHLRSCGKAVLAGVTGELAAAKVTAIMGPSGAGKTSLLNALAGKAASYGVQSGVVLVNGRRDRLERYKRVMGFVPQNDIMHSSLTVHENLLFSARYRLPANASREQRLWHVERAISVLQLEDVRDELVGDEETRGISGGQKKRVNVGLELVADPLLLFLDEPTSGLDSSSSKALVAALQAVVRGGVTAAAVIHQPSWETCLLFDDLLLLGKGGRTVFYGRVGDMQAYFEGLGFDFPLHQNPVDCCMDIVSGAVMRDGQASAAELFDVWDDHCGRPRRAGADNGLPTVTSCDPLPPGSDAGADAAEAAEAGGALGEPAEGRSALLGGEEERHSWRRRMRDVLIYAGAVIASGATDAWRSLKQSLPQLGSAARTGKRLFKRGRQRIAAGYDGLASDGAGEDEGGGGSSATRRAARRITPGFLPQLWWSLCRAVLMRSREPLAVFTDYSVIALTGMTLGLISDRGRETIMHFAVSITYSVVALGLMSTVGALNTFGANRLVFFREASSGLNRLSHFLALELFDHTGTVLRSTIYFTMYYSFAAPRAVIWQMLLVSMAITYCCTGMAYVLSQVLEPSAAQLSAAVLALINTLIARQGHAHGLIRLAQSFSFARWGLEGYVISESNKLTGVWLLARCADLQGLEYDVRRFGLCLLALVGLGLLFRAAALLAMLCLHRDKQR